MAAALPREGARGRPRQVREAKPFPTGGQGDESQGKKTANLSETDWQSKSWNQSVLFYFQGGELEERKYTRYKGKTEEENKRVERVREEEEEEEEKDLHAGMQGSHSRMLHWGLKRMVSLQIQRGWCFGGTPLLGFPRNAPMITYHLFCTHGNYGDS